MFGVNTAGEYLRAQHAPKEETQVSVATAKAPETEETSSAVKATFALQTDVSSIVESAMPSVVAITNTMVLEQRTWFGSSQRYEVPSSGSGIVVGQNDDELLIVTNNHVVDSAQELSIGFIDGSDAEAKVKGTDRNKDLAVLSVKMEDLSEETKEKIRVIELGKSSELQVGQQVAENKSTCC